VKRYIKHLILSFLFWKVVRWVERMEFFPPQRRTVKRTHPLPTVPTVQVPCHVNGISAGDFFKSKRPQNRRLVFPGDLSEEAFNRWRAQNDR
jgi:hypothetical protein